MGRTDTARRAVVGVGNVLLSDEGVGIHAVRRMEGMPPPDGVLVFDGGTEGFGLMDIVSDLDRLVVVDCVRAGEAPGTIYRFDAEDIGPCADRYQTSLHQVGIVDILHLVDLIGTRPYTTIVGVEPASLDMGTSLSPEVRARLDRVVEIGLEQVMLDRPPPAEKRLSIGE